MLSVFLFALVIVTHEYVRCKCDAPENWQMNLQDSATLVCENMIDFHSVLLQIAIIIGTAVCYLIGYIIYTFGVENIMIKPIKFSHSSELEIIWTIIPAFLLLILAIPSFTLLYSLDDIIEPNMTVKVIGHQWYWTYEYADEEEMINNTYKEAYPESKHGLGFDSYLIDETNLNSGQLRLLEVDNRMFVPTSTHIRLLLTSSDVLHSWAVPSLGIKMDACPGRLSQVTLNVKRPGIYYGQCSEICGINHGFMPIVVEAVNKINFTDWFYIRCFS